MCGVLSQHVLQVKPEALVEAKHNTQMTFTKNMYLEAL